MADFYANEFIGVVDGTVSPPRRADARVVGSRLHGIRAVKPTNQALAAADRLYIGRKRKGETVECIEVTASVNLTTTTLSVGPTSAATKYANAKTMTVADIPTPIGPAAAASDDDPDGVDEDLWLTVGVTAIAAGTLLVVDTTIRGVN